MSEEDSVEESTEHACEVADISPGVPARIHIAMSFVHYMGTTRFVNITGVDVRSVVDCETKAYASACKLLDDWFAGRIVFFNEEMYGAPTIEH